VNRRTLLAASGLAVAAPFLTRPSLAQGAGITGAGASFPNPVYQK
jgi:ABC-type phosphate transport system substrate-binding protein